MQHLQLMAGLGFFFFLVPSGIQGGTGGVKSYVVVFVVQSGIHVYLGSPAEVEH